MARVNEISLAIVEFDITCYDKGTTMQGLDFGHGWIAYTAFWMGSGDSVFGKQVLQYVFPVRA